MVSNHYGNVAAEDGKGTGTAWFKLGEARRKVGRLEESVAAFRSAIKGYPELAEARVGLVRALIEVPLLEQAKIDCQESIAYLGSQKEPQLSNNKNSSEKRKLSLQRLLLYICAQLECEMDAADDAAELALVLQRSREQGKQDHAILDEQTIDLLSHTLLSIATQRSDLKFWQLACVVEPSLEHIIGLGGAYLDAGELTPARNCLCLAMRMSPQEWRAPHLLGMLEFRCGRFRSAAGYFETALDLCSRTPPNSPQRAPSALVRQLSTLPRLESQTADELSELKRSPRERTTNRRRVSVVFEDHGRGLMAGRIQLYFGASLLNGGDVVGARHHVSCSAHSLGSVHNFARLLLTALLLKVGQLESAMNMLNLARKDVDEAVFEGGAGNMPLQEQQQQQQQASKIGARRRRVSSFQSVATNGAADLGEDFSHALRFHWATAQLVRLAYQNPEIQEKKKILEMNKLFDLELVCLNDLLRRDPGNADAKHALEGAQARHNETKERIATLECADDLKARLVNDPHHIRHHSLLARYRSEGDKESALSSAERLAILEQQEKKQKLFMQSLQDRRERLEHDMENEHAHQHSDFDFEEQEQE